MLRTLRSTIEMGIGATTAVMMVACAYNPPTGLDTPASLYRTLNTAPYGTPSAAERWTVIDDPGRLRVDHGYACVNAARGGTRDYVGIRIRETATLPADYNATVFLNGSKANYASKDHHVTGLGSVIFNVMRQGGELVWDAGGLLSDKNGDDAFKWCYHYTLLYWPASSSEFDIRPVHSDSSGQLLFVQSATQSGVVHSIPGSFTSDGAGRPPRAALPAGAAMFWTKGDNHVLQTGFDLGNQSLSGTTLSWSSSAILKDNRASREYYAMDSVSILRGNYFGVSHPATVLLRQDDGSWASRSNQLSLTPRAPKSCARAELGDTTHIREFAVTGLAATYAIPMLTGWDLRYNCEDQHVRSVGAWIEDWHYEPPTTRFGHDGTLYYTVHSTLADKGGTPNFIDQLEVSLLNISLPSILANVPGGGRVLPSPFLTSTPSPSPLSPVGGAPAR